MDTVPIGKATAKQLKDELNRRIDLGGRESKAELLALCKIIGITKIRLRLPS